MPREMEAVTKALIAAIQVFFSAHNKKMPGRRLQSMCASSS